MDDFLKYLKNYGNDMPSNMEQPPVSDAVPQAPQMPEQAPSPQMDPRMLEAMKMREDRERRAMLMMGLNQLTQAGVTSSGSKAQISNAIPEQMMKSAQNPIQDLKMNLDQERMKQKQSQDQERLGMDKEKHSQIMEQYAQRLEQGDLDITNAKRTQDPATPESKLAQEFAMEVQPNLNKETISQMSAAELYKYIPQMQQLVVAKLRAETAGRQMEMSERRLQQGEERLKVRERDVNRKERQGDERIGLSKDKMEWQKEEKDELSDKQTETVAGYDEALNLIKDANELKKSVDTGPVTNVTDKARGVVGMQDPEVAKLKMALGENLASKVRSLSGTAASDKEREFISSISLPTINDNDEVFAAKMEQAVKTLERSRKLRLDSYKKQGKDSSSFEKGNESSSNEIRRRDPKSGKIAIFDENKKFLRFEE